MIDYAAETTLRLDVDRNDDHVSATKFSTSGRVEFDLNRYFVRQDAADAIREMTIVGNRRDLAAGIRDVHRRVFSDNPGDRDGVQDIMVIVTDDTIDDLREAVLAANEAKDDDVEIIVVIVGGNARTSDLRSIASTADEVISISRTSSTSTTAVYNYIVARRCRGGGGKPRQIARTRPENTIL